METGIKERQRALTAEGELKPALRIKLRLRLSTVVLHLRPTAWIFKKEIHQFFPLVSTTNPRWMVLLAYLLITPVIHSLVNRRYLSLSTVYIYQDFCLSVISPLWLLTICRVEGRFLSPISSVIFVCNC